MKTYNKSEKTVVNKGEGWNTAIQRKGLSAPMQYLIKNDLLNGKTLDYGCGRGQDAEFLGIDRFDPNWGFNEIDGKYDFITCNFVLNVIMEFEDRKAVITAIKNLLNNGGTAYISVRADLKEDTKTQRNLHLDKEFGFELISKKGSYRLYKFSV